MEDHEKKQQITANEVTKCVVCREEIQNEAKKCIHCDSYQNWRKYLSLSNTSLSLVIALISVSTVAIPIFKNLFENKHEEITVNVIGNSGGRLVILFSNPGTGTGILSSEAEVIFENATKPTYKVYLDENINTETNDFSRLLLKANESRILLGRMDGDAPKATNVKNELCSFEIDVYDQQSNKRKASDQFSCTNPK